jgi:anaerobic selenocysteine-containing dehydrogenase
VHPEDLAELGIGDGELLEIASPRGAICAPARASVDLRRGTISMAHAWGDLLDRDGRVDPTVGGASTGRLIGLDVGFDRLTGMPVQSAIPVALRPLRNPGHVPEAARADDALG